MAPPLIGNKRKREKQELDLEILKVEEVEKPVVKWSKPTVNKAAPRIKETVAVPAKQTLQPTKSKGKPERKQSARI